MYNHEDPHMQTQWNYTELAEFYLYRPDYSQNAVNQMLEISSVTAPAKVCDIGAGTAHLTLMLALKNLDVTAVEPNDAMRRNGEIRTKGFKNVSWHEGTGENTYQPINSFDLVTFGSSFNTTNRIEALKETKRILKAKGWIACMWNHRDLSDETQCHIEKIIKSTFPNYSYGTRREDQVDIINESNLFNHVIKIEGQVLHEQSIDDIIKAWRSHATLHRQAGEKFKEIIHKIEHFLKETHGNQLIKVPYITRLWMAQIRD